MNMTEVKPGDKLLRSYGYRSSEIVTVDRITDTQVICGLLRYNRNTGRRVGKQSGWTGDWIVRVATQQDADKFELNELADRLSEMSATQWKSLGLFALRDISFAVARNKPADAVGGAA
jgi:hypothetical protein